MSMTDAIAGCVNPSRFSMGCWQNWALASSTPAGPSIRPDKLRLSLIDLHRTSTELSTNDSQIHVALTEVYQPSAVYQAQYLGLSAYARSVATMLIISVFSSLRILLRKNKMIVNFSNIQIRPVSMQFAFSL